MSARDPQFDQYVLKIHAFLDRLDYYRLLGVNRDAATDDIKQTFYAIAKKFHPDRNRDADRAVRRALYDIYKRLNEAYRVLLDDDKRACYDRALTQGEVRLVQDMRGSFSPKAPIDTIQSKSAREFYAKAEEQLADGNLLQADLHIKMALSKERDNEAIRALWQQISQAKKQKKEHR
jgi:DnaJ-class molecular chaperone